ncbi:hypothetical protein QQ73_10070, partial [Candidatus Endoriftia persephone str. Guaymas]|nr:hypothetical protein [Candidatus Endoriftia persephone str. Guaymas]
TLRRAAQQGDAVGLLFQSQQRVAHSSAAALRLQVHPRAVVIAGILIGLLLPHLRFQRRRNNWGAL